MVTMITTEEALVVQCRLMDIVAQLGRGLLVCLAVENDKLFLLDGYKRFPLCLRRLLLLPVNVISPSNGQKCYWNPDAT